MTVEVDITVLASLSATEDPEKVVGAIKRIFPDVVCKQQSENGIVVCEGHDASKMREMIFGRRIIDTVRSGLLSRRCGSKTQIELNRQAAAAGRLSIDAVGGSPLVVEFRCSYGDMEGFIDWLTPITIEGKPVVIGEENHGK